MADIALLSVDFMHRFDGDLIPISNYHESLCPTGYFESKISPLLYLLLR